MPKTSAANRQQLAEAIKEHYVGVVEAESSLPRDRHFTCDEWWANAARWKATYPKSAAAF